MFDKNNKVFSQQKLLARVNAKTYLSKFKLNTTEIIKENNFFNNFKEIILKEQALKTLTTSTKKTNKSDEELLKTVDCFIQDSVDRTYFSHKEILEKKRQDIEHERLNGVERQKYIEQEKEQARIAREKRRHQKKVDKLRANIKDNIIRTSNMKNEYYFEDIMSTAGYEDYNQQSIGDDSKNDYGKF
jgi:alpha-galactosidase/6-phospho-beta-glucosidase family protein